MLIVSVLFLQDLDITNQEAVDQIMFDLDGTENKCKCPLDYILISIKIYPYAAEG